MSLKNILNNLERKTETLYSSHKKMVIIEGVELPKKWIDFNHTQLKEEARKAMLELSRNSNSDFKAKQIGFNDAKHLIKICFGFILK